MLWVFVLCSLMGGSSVVGVSGTMEVSSRLVVRVRARCVWFSGVLIPGQGPHQEGMSDRGVLPLGVRRCA